MRYYFYISWYKVGNETAYKKWYVDSFKTYMLVKTLFDVSKVTNKTYIPVHDKTSNILTNHFPGYSSITKRFQIEHFFTAIGLFGKWM